jgi:hypothetical protein
MNLTLSSLFYIASYFVNDFLITKAIPTGKININYFDYYSGNITPVVKNECKLLSEQGFNVTQCSVSYLHSDFIATIKAFKNKS